MNATPPGAGSYSGHLPCGTAGASKPSDCHTGGHRRHEGQGAGARTGAPDGGGGDGGGTEGGQAAGPWMRRRVAGAPVGRRTEAPWRMRRMSWVGVLRGGKGAEKILGRCLNGESACRRICEGELGIGSSLWLADMRVCRTLGETPDSRALRPERGVALVTGYDRVWASLRHNPPGHRLPRETRYRSG